MMPVTSVVMTPVVVINSPLTAEGASSVVQAFTGAIS